MGIHKRLWNWCRRPKKRTSTLLTRLAISLHLRNLIKSSHLFLRSAGLISFLVSLPLFYTGFLIVDCFVSGNSLGPVKMITNPFLFLFSIPMFIGVWVTIDSLLEEMRKKGTKGLLFATLSLIIVPAGLAAGLHNSLFDSITLLPPSGMDLYNCWVLLNINNRGLTDVQISKIEIGNLICDVSSQWYNNNIKRGENRTLFIYYAHERFTWEEIWGAHDPYSTTGGFHSNLEIAPTTFREGNIPIVIYTDGIITYRFEIEARPSKPEEIHGFSASIINLGKGKVEDQNYCLPDIYFRLEMAPNSIAYVYSVDIGNLTIKLNPPLLIRGYDHHNDFALYLSDYLYFGHITVYGLPTNAIPSQPLNSLIFRVGETYNVTIWTMADNKYTASIKMID